MSGADQEQSVTLMMGVFDATYTGERWEGENADIFEYLVSLGKLPWPLRMSIQCIGGSITLKPEQPGCRTDEGTWIPSVQRFEIVKEVGTRRVGQFYTKPCKEAITVEIVKEQVRACVREMAVMMERVRGST